MITLAAMMLIYGACCFGSMKKVAFLYFGMTCINAAIYPILYVAGTTENSPWVSVIYGYGITESFLKLVFLIRTTRFKHSLLIALLFGHIVNDAFNSFHYGFVNSAIIICEMIYFIKESDGIFNKISDKLSPRNIWGLRNNRGYS